MNPKKVANQKKREKKKATRDERKAGKEYIKGAAEKATHISEVPQTITASDTSTDRTDAKEIAAYTSSAFSRPTIGDTVATSLDLIFS